MKPIFIIRYLSVLAVAVITAWLAPYSIWIAILLGVIAAIVWDNIFVRVYNFYRRRNRGAH